MLDETKAAASSMRGLGSLRRELKNLRPFFKIVITCVKYCTFSSAEEL